MTNSWEIFKKCHNFNVTVCKAVAGVSSRLRGTSVAASL